MKTAQRVAFATCALTLVLVGLGALVRATGSGLGCPDWPTCHGGVLPPGTQGHKPLIEFSHRFVAALVGLLVIATAVYAWRHFRHAPFTLWTAVLAVPLVGIQGILGAITVKRELPPEIVATHLLTAMLVLTFEAAAAFSMYIEVHGRPEAVRAPSRRIALMAVAASGWMALAVWVGGYMSESGASTACSGWPLCNGSAFPASNGDQEVTHMLHRYLAGALILFVVPLVFAAWRARGAVRWAAPVALALGSLYVAQVAAGALNVAYEFPDPLTVTHTAVAGLIWFTLSSAAILGLYVPAGERRQAAHARVPA